MNDSWNKEKEDLLFSWTNQIGVNRKAHYDAAIRCRRGYYSLKVPHIFLLSINVALVILNVETMSGGWRIAYLVISILVAISLFFMDQIINLLGWSEASIIHSATVRDLDSLRFEMQREFYTPIAERRHWEPLMVFITEKINQINSTKTTQLLRKNFDDSMVDIMSLRWKGFNDTLPERRNQQNINEEIRELREQGDIYDSIHDEKREKSRSLWRRVVDTIRKKEEPQGDIIMTDPTDFTNNMDNQSNLSISRDFPEEELV